MNYPDEYTADQGLKVIKFEKDYKKGRGGRGGWSTTGQTLEYEFFRSFPIAINSMPVSYGSVDVLKCTVSMSYIRYIVRRINSSSTAKTESSNSPQQKSDFQQALDLNIADKIQTNFSEVYSLSDTTPINFSTAASLNLGSFSNPN